jgi:cobalt/nickel transport system permease protein
VSLAELWLDEHASRDSPLHRWDPRYKLVGLMGLILSFSMVRDLRLLPAMLAVAAILYALCRLPFSFLVSRLRYPGFFLLFVVVLSLLTGSTVVLEIGPLALRQEGSLAALLIAARFVSILTVGLVLFGTAPFVTTVRAMRALGMPALLTDMTLLVYRYFYETGADLRRMQRAMRLRGFDAHHLARHTLNRLASLIGSLFVRSYERSERVYRAMALRGYGQATTGDTFQARPFDAISMGCALLVAASLIVAEMLSRGNIW